MSAGWWTTHLCRCRFEWTDCSAGCFGMPPTYSTAPGQVQYIMAGGPKALASAVEVNEDSEELGQRDIARRRPTRKDIVVGVSASGRTPYVVAAVAYAARAARIRRPLPVTTTLRLSAAADIVIVAEVGPEVVSGSTRMKAGTAQKMVLNMITTGAMTRLGYVYENLMVNVHMQNSKLVERGIRILMAPARLTGRRLWRQSRAPAAAFPWRW